jgi:DNA adenine methylase
MKTPLRYPGGKSRAVKHILPLIPEGTQRLCSPFLGGGSIELAVAERGTRVYGYDIFDPIVWFWQALLSEPKKLAILADSFRMNHPDYVLNKKNVRGLLKEDFIRFRNELKVETDYSLMNAARVYAINRSSFSGATFSGGFSKRASYARFTDSSIERIRSFKEPNLTVEQADFKVSIPKHPDTFLYCDPPYLLGGDRDKLYGIQGSTHAGFDHRGLYDLLSQRSGWVLSYNDCPEIRKLYKDFEIRSAEWAYGMKNVGKNKMGSSSEILIIG